MPESPEDLYRKIERHTGYLVLGVIVSVVFFIWWAYHAG